MKKLILYLLRWQLSTPILALVIYYLNNYNIIIATVIANLIGGLLFYKVDEKILNKGD